MTQQVFIPQKKDQLGQALQIGGAVAGGVIGGAPGASLGASLGGTAAGFLSSNDAAVAPAPTSQNNAMQRRMGSPPPTANIASNEQADLTNATIALSQMPPEIQREYEAPLRHARLLSRRGVHVGNPGDAPGGEGIA
jgi:hypothetical protein